MRPTDNLPPTPEEQLEALMAELTATPAHETIQRMGLHLRLGDLLAQGGSHPKALSHFEEAHEMATAARQHDTAVQAAQGMARAHEALGQPHEVLRVLTATANGPATQASHATRASLMYDLGGVHLDADHPEAAVAAFSQCIQSAKKAANHRTRLSALLGLSDAYSAQRAFNQAFKTLEDALRATRSTGNHDLGPLTLNKMGQLCYEMGEYDRGVSFLKDSLTMSGKQDAATQEVGHAHELLGVLYQSIPTKYEEAASQYEAALAQYRNLGERHGEARALNALSSLLLADIPEKDHEKTDEAPREDPNGEATRETFFEVCRFSEAALAILEELGEKVGQATAHINLGEALTHLYSEEEAVPHLHKALELAEKDSSLHSISMRGSFLLGTIAFNNGDLEEAANHTAKASAYAEALGDTVLEIEYRVKSVKIYEQLGKKETAFEETQKVLALIDDIEDPDMAFSTTYEMGVIQSDMAYYEEAMNTLEQARYLLEYATPNPHHELSVLCAMSTNTLKMGQPERTEALAAKALRYIEKNNLHDDIDSKPSLLMTIAMAAKERGDYVKSVQYFVMARPLLQHSSQPDGVPFLDESALDAARHADRNALKAALAEVESGEDIWQSMNKAAKARRVGCLRRLLLLLMLLSLLVWGIIKLVRWLWW